MIYCIDTLYPLQPERILGGEYGIHSEVWSLGVSLLEVRYSTPFTPTHTSCPPLDVPGQISISSRGIPTS